MSDKTLREIAMEKIEEVAKSKANSLSLVGLSIFSMHPEISQLTHLTELNYHGNLITNVIPGIRQLINLEALDLSTNQLIHLPPEIGELSKLITLDLSDNRLIHLPAEIGQLTNLTLLDLSNNQLTKLPSEIGQLTNLILLNLSYNGFTSLPPEIEKLTNLTRINLSGNKLTSLKVSSVPLIKILLEKAVGLDALTLLDLSDSQLTHLPPEIGKLTNLTELNLSKNKLTRLPPEIGQLTNLTSLDISDNPITSIKLTSPHLIKLVLKQAHNIRDLTSLDISDCQLTNIPHEISELTQLTSLNISNNQINNLSPELQRLRALKKLDLRGNSLPVPPEILDKVDDPQSILNYLSWVLDGKRQPLAETKMLVVGQGSVGKTSLIRRLTNNKFSSREIKTNGIAINRWQVANEQTGEHQPENLRVNIWDFGGQEIMHATHQFFLTRRSLYLLVLDARLTQEENRVEYWLKIIQSFGGDSPVLLVGNKTDQHPLDIDRTGLQKKYPNIVGILETSAFSGTGLEELKDSIAEQVNRLPHIRDILPGAWFNVKNQLEELGHAQNYIAQEKYAETCATGEIRDETSQRTLIGFLHDLGIVLHFQDDPRLEALGILNPQWVTNGVYKILNAHALFQNKGVLERAMLDEILDFPEYPANKRLFIVDMMRKFELCYDLEPDKTFLVPDLLPKDEPFIGEWNGALAFQYHYDVLPSSIVSRFIVRMNAYIHKTVWRSGVVLKKDENTALVKADMEDRKIYIWVNGAEHTRRDFLAAIRAEFDAIHKTIIKIEATEKVPVPGHPETEPIPFEMLSQAEREGRASIPVMSGGRLIDVDVRELLNGIAPETDPSRVGNVTNIHIGKDFTGNLTVGDENTARSTVSPVKTPAPAPVPDKPAESAVGNQSPLLKILTAIFVSLPRIIGRAALDIFGRGKDSADTTSVLLGYVLLILAALVLWGIIDINSLRDWFAGWWRFFFPVK